MIMKKEILIEEPLSNLYTKTTNNFDTPRDTDSVKVRVKSYEAIPAVGDKQLQFNFDTSSTGKTYKTTIVFEGVEFRSEETSTTVTVKGADGSDYFIEPLSYSQMDVKVRCECLDFYYRFAAWNQQKNSLFGDAPQPYVKKTNRPPVNPKKESGLCKHLMKAVDHLGTLRILR